jgi:hypothetical protein
MKRVAFYVMGFCGVLAAAGSEARACHLGRRGSLGINPVQAMAMMSQAMAQYNLATAAAARNNELAYSQYLDNRRAAAEKRLAARWENESHRAEQRKAGITSEQREQTGRSHLPQRLNSEQWQPLSGTFQWPEALSGDGFAAERRRLEQLFAQRTREASGLGSSNYDEVRSLVRTMQGRLARQAKQLGVEEFSRARKFLESVAYEARFASFNSQVAGK